MNGADEEVYVKSAYFYTRPSIGITKQVSEYSWKHLGNDLLSASLHGNSLFKSLAHRKWLILSGMAMRLAKLRRNPISIPFWWVQSVHVTRVHFPYLGHTVDSPNSIAKLTHSDRPEFMKISQMSFFFRGKSKFRCRFPEKKKGTYIVNLGEKNLRFPPNSIVDG